MGRIFYLMGKSSVGKDSIFRKLQEKMQELYTIILYTTRPKRAGEQDGKEYYFVDDQMREKWEKAGKIIELRAYNTMHGVWQYFMVDDGQIDLDKGNYLVIGTLESYKQMCRYFGEDILLPIYLEVESGIRLKRALEREESQVEPRYEELCRRFLADEMDFSEENLGNMGIKRKFQNLDLDKCTNEIILFIRGCL